MALLASLPALQPSHSLLRTGPVATSSCAGRCAGSGTCPEDCSKLPGRSKPLPHGRRGRRRVLPSPSSASARPSFLTGVGTPWRGSPRVASRTRQPWAGGHNPFGIEARARFTLGLRRGRSVPHVALILRYRPAPPLSPKGIPPQSPAIAEITRGFPFSYCPIHPIRICFGFRASDFGFPPPPVCALQISAV